MYIWAIILLSFPVLYVLVITLYIRAWKDLAVWSPNLSEQQAKTSFSIIIPARNEAENIETCIQSILNQNYPQDLYEIIIVDDFSEDATPKIVQAFAKQYPQIQLIQLADHCDPNSTYSFKKKAIETALEYSKGDWIITTDADCIADKNWLTTLETYIQSNNYVFVAAPVIFTADDSAFQAFQALDFMGMMLVTGAGIHWRFMRMCNGANLAYQKSIFYEVNGFEGINHLASGDDMLLMQKVAKKYPKGIGFLKSTAAVIQTTPKEDLASFVQQRIRWASKSGAYQEWQVQAILAVVWLTCVSVLVSLVSSLFLGWLFLMIVPIQLLIKGVADFFFLRLAAQFFNRQALMRHFIAAFFMHTLYILVIGFLGNVKKTYQWKGRKVR